MSSKQSKAIVRLSHEKVWSKGNLEAVDEIYADDFVCHFVVGPEWQGPDGVKQQVRQHRTAFPDWTERIEDIIAVGDRVVTRFTSTGTHRGEFEGIPPTGRKVAIQEVAIYRVVRGKIAELWGFPDLHGLLNQLQPPAEKNRAARMALVQRDFEMWNTGNLRIADEIYAPEYVGHFVGSVEWRGIEELKQEVTRLRTVIPDLNAPIEDTIIEADKATVRFTVSGTHMGVFEGIPATGAKFSFPSIMIYRFVGDKIVETWEHPDLHEARRQIELAQKRNDP